ncbi:hypothetical protein RHE_PF00021 (plasmid) [Rhizobium etli CFN 42]|uniref:Uncharacterized protein n=1 Tax=Rhizobium etli (strain ATCC 51251 / DSM 11541 / JCM 21823 / NBRC 15573 / CFN 42) TaxID=347834 RepID=Q2JZS1_RHIEC|nr:hypothetical protein [Rhizobium etli]ABC93915.1 hypothetical protein RHE_PF00021 [Rhizobium etli CFN 42]
MLNPSVRFSPSNVATLKKALRGHYPYIKSSHLDEAIAASFGFKSYAAMRPVLYQLGASARLVVVVDRLLLVLRLEQLGYGGVAPESLRRLVWSVEFPDDQYDDDVGQMIRMRRRPTAANAD